MIIIDKDGTIHLYQGDSGEIIVTGLGKCSKGTVYLAIQDIDRNPIGEELQVSVNNSDMVTFVLTSDFTENLNVPKNKPYQIYFYGIKVCESDSLVEDTLFIDNATYGDLNAIVVYPRKVKGVQNNGAI